MLKRSKRNVKVMLTDPPHITGHAGKGKGENLLRQSFALL
jgi:hypothetical protein